MEYKNDALEVSFSLPDAITVRQQLNIKSRMVMMFDIDDYYMIFWNSLLPVIENWKCKTIPDPKELDMNESTDPKVARIVVWVCTEANRWFTGLESVEKN